MTSILIKIGKSLFAVVLLLWIPFLNAGKQIDLSDEDLQPLISLSDRYCSMFIWEGKLPELKIVDREIRTERIMMKNNDVVYLNSGSASGLQEGQVFLIVEIGPKMKNFGRIARKQGRARIIMVDEGKAAAELEHICGLVKIGHALIPFEEKEGWMGKDLGYDVSIREGDGIIGHFLYLHDGFVQIGSNHLALIDLGSQNGIRVGDQLLAFRRNSKNAFPRTFANMIVIDVQSRTSTVKILSCKDVVRITDSVTRRPKDTSPRPGTGAY
jgi:hypothetical protein